jgi:hypothetical protein
VERFGDIVVGAGIHAGDLVAPPLTGRKDEHGHLAVVAPPLLEHAQAVFLGKAEVKHHGVVRLGIAEEMPLLPVKGGIDRIARIAQCRYELPVEGLDRLPRREAASSYPPGALSRPSSS